MKYSDDLLRAIATIKGTHHGRVLMQHIADLLSLANKKAAYGTTTEEKYHYSGRAQQLYEFQDLFNECVDILNKRKTR